MINKSYLEVGRVQTVLHYFAVPKGDSDIRVCVRWNIMWFERGVMEPKLFTHFTSCSGIAFIRFMDGGC